MPTHLTLTRVFGPDQDALGAYNHRSLGFREVSLAAIVGTVGRPGLRQPRRLAALRRTDRYQRILAALAAGQRLPSVRLALLGGHFYIEDGHHRLAAARQLGAIEADAEVTEYLPDVESPAAAWHRAFAGFEREAGPLGLHVRAPEGYARLRQQIAEHGWYMGERGTPPSSFAAAAAAWLREIYWPVLADLAMRGALDRARGLTVPELYLAVCDHKWYRSERLARDIGFATAVDDVARGRHLPWAQRLRGRMFGSIPLLAG
jgi:hypothetical protein